MGRRWLCVLLVAASVQFCLSSSTEGALAVTELSDTSDTPEVASAKKQASDIVTQAKKHAAAVEAKANDVMQQAEGMKDRIEQAQAEIQKQKQAVKVETAAAQQALSQAKQTAVRVQADGAVAAKASQDAQAVQKETQENAAETEKEEKKTRGNLKASKVMAAAQAAVQMENAQAQTMDAAQAKSEATSEKAEAQTAKDALSAEIVKVNAANQRNKELEGNLRKETEKEESTKAEAQQAVGEVQQAKAKIKKAAKKAIEQAVQKAADVAHKEQNRLNLQQAEEREKQATSSAQSLADEAKASAQAKLAQQKMAKAKKMMAEMKEQSQAPAEDTKDQSGNPGTADQSTGKPTAAEQTGDVGEAGVEDTTSHLLKKSMSQEAAKEVKAGAKVEIQKTKAQVAQKVKNLTHKLEKSEVQKLDAETKEKVQEANAVKQINAADKLKIDFKQQAAATQAVVVEKKQARQALKTSTEEVHHLQTRLKESRSQSAKGETALQRIEKKQKLQSDTLKWEVTHAETELATAQRELTALHAQRLKLAKGAINCNTYHSHISGVAEKLAKKLAMEADSGDPSPLELLERQVDVLEKQVKSKEGAHVDSVLQFKQLVENTLKNTQEEKDQQSEIQKTKITGTDLAKGLKLTEEENLKHESKLRQKKRHLRDITMRLVVAQAKAAEFPVCENAKRLAIEKCKLDRENEAQETIRKLQATDSAAAINGHAYEKCNKKLEQTTQVSNDVKAELMTLSEKKRTINARHASLMKDHKQSYTEKVRDRTRDEETTRCKALISTQIAKLTQVPPMSKKCKACTRLGREQQAALEVDCKGCAGQKE